MAKYTKYIKVVLNKILSKFDLCIMPKWQLKTLEMDETIKRLFEKHNIDCVIDVGANRGQYHDYLRDIIEYKGLIISFEPISENVNLLKSRAKNDKGWLVEACAIGSSEEEKSFNVMEVTEFSSFHDPVHIDTKRFETENVVKRQETVTVKRLDNVLSSIRKEYEFKNLCLKMDTQGYDLEVLKGSESELGDIRIVQSEAPVLTLYKGAPTFIESVAYLLKKNFDIVGIYAVNRDENDRAFDMDCIFLNKKYCNLS